MQDHFINIKLSIHNIDIYVMRKAILSYVSDNSKILKGKTLDIGCGIMPYKKIILSQNKVSEYIGMDITNSNHHDTSVADVHWDGKTIPFADATFDSALATEFLEHHFETAEILKEISRILKPNGSILLTMPFLWPLHETPNDAYRITPFSIRYLLEKAGFEQVSVKATGGLNSSLVLLYGLWLNTSLGYGIRKKIISSISFPFIKYLLKKDKIPNEFTDNSMIIGIGVTAVKKHVR